MDGIFQVVVGIDRSQDDSVGENLCLVVVCYARASIVQVAFSQRHEGLVELFHILLMRVVGLLAASHLVHGQYVESGSPFKTGEEDLDAGLLSDGLGAKVFANGSCSVPYPALEKVEIVGV